MPFCWGAEGGRAYHVPRAITDADEHDGQGVVTASRAKQNRNSGQGKYQGAADGGGGKLRFIGSGRE